jgi:alanyl-tRNA synthetase
LEKAVIVLYAISNDKINVITGISKSIAQQSPPAGEFVKLLCGRGGGRPDMAQGGGLVPDDLDERIAKLEEMLVGCVSN